MLRRWNLGEAVQKVLEQFYREDVQGIVLTTAGLVETFDAPPVRRESNLRQIHRALKRLNVVPQAIYFDGFLRSVGDDGQRQEIKILVSRARECRMPVSIVRCCEVRLGRWVCVWNNLRGERHWVWWSADEAGGEDATVGVKCLMNWHRKPCCLLFDKSAFGLSRKLKILLAEQICEAGEHFAIVDGAVAV